MSDVVAHCPSCGGSGGGPFGRPGSAWDVEGYVCPRCRGIGIVSVTEAGGHRLAKTAPLSQPAIARPSITGTRPEVASPRKRRSPSRG
jgi:hypothetical protein